MTDRPHASTYAPVHLTPRVEPPLTSWWLDVSREQWPAAVEGQRDRWHGSALARALVPSGGVPVLGVAWPRRTDGDAR